MRFLYVILMALSVGASGLVHARLYKWQDDNGDVHYSDSIPPDEAGRRRERELKSDSGQTLKVVEPPPTREQLDRAAAQRRLADERARREERSAERDRALLLMFSSVEDMRDARDDRLSAIDGLIALTDSRLETLRARLAERRDAAARLERSGGGDPEPIYREIDQLETVVSGHEDYIAGKEAEKRRIRERFRRDIGRYRTLTDGDEPSPQTASE